jgi:hypothetical protein
MNPIVELILLFVGAFTLFVLAILFVIWVVLPGLAAIVRWVLGE